MTRRFKRTQLLADHADDGRTLQSQSEATDINKLLKHYAKTGTFTHVAHEMPQYGDFSNPTDYLGAMLQVKSVERLFGECSSSVRARFQNNPALMLEFLADPANDEEAVKLGLAEGSNRREPDEPAEIPPVEDPGMPDPPENPVQGGE